MDGRVANTYDHGQRIVTTLILIIPEESSIHLMSQDVKLVLAINTPSLVAPNET